MTKATKAQAVDEQYGGVDETAPPAPGLDAPAQRSNAYCLVYVMEAAWSDVMATVTSDDVAQHLRDCLEVGLQAQCCLWNAAPLLASAWRRDLPACKHKLRMVHCEQAVRAATPAYKQSISACLEVRLHTPTDKLLAGRVRPASSMPLQCLLNASPTLVGLAAATAMVVHSTQPWVVGIAHPAGCSQAS